MLLNAYVYIQPSFSRATFPKLCTPSLQLSKRHFVSWEGINNTSLPYVKSAPPVEVGQEISGKKLLDHP